MAGRHGQVAGSGSQEGAGEEQGGRGGQGRQEEAQRRQVKRSEEKPVFEEVRVGGRELYILY